MLAPDARHGDPWREAASGLERTLAERPDLERRLLDPPPAELAPADRMFRALVLEERGGGVEATELAAHAERDLYTASYLECRDRMLACAAEELARGSGPIVDLASGRCTLMERLARDLDRPLVATDVSPVVLRRSRERLRARGVADRVEFVCLDARRLPFADGSIATLTTFLGLGNVSEPGSLLTELSRVVSGVFTPVCTFFPASDDANRTAARAAGVERLLVAETAEVALVEAGWHVEAVASCSCDARPTPASVVFEGARVDGLPVADTQVEWRLLRARPWPDASGRKPARRA
jgi:hypothetical protein